MGWVFNPEARKEGKKADVSFLSEKRTGVVREFFKTFSEYAPTPLVPLPGLADALGIGGLYLKDESRRFGLNAFKVLGCGFAMARVVADRMGVDMADLTAETLRSEAARAAVGEITFVSATDGNHGRGVAWAARQMGQKSVIYMPKGSSVTRLENIRREGAFASITDMNYDDCVRLAWQEAQEKGWILVQDTAWEGYEDIPSWIMQGYATLILEAVETLREWKEDGFTHLFLQAGVGSFAGAIQGFLADALGADRPVTVIVEPEKADCIYQSALAGDGKPRFVTGDLDTLMAGLACGEPNIIGWEILRDYSDGYISCPDWVSANGMRILGAPCGKDPRIISGESGAVTTGILAEIMKNPRLSDVRSALSLGADSRVLVISTEGDTDPDMYRNITWNGCHGRPEETKC